MSEYTTDVRHQLLDIEGDNPSKRMFVFPEAARAEVPKFFTNEPVDARDFAAALKADAALPRPRHET